MKATRATKAIDQRTMPAICPPLRPPPSFSVGVTFVPFEGFTGGGVVLMAVLLVLLMLVLLVLLVLLELALVF